MRNSTLSILLCVLMLQFLPHYANAQSCVSPSANLGQIMYNDDFDVFQGCTQRGWIAFHVVGTGSPTPSLLFSFPNVANADFNTLYESSIVAAAGLGGPIELSISGDGSPQFRTRSANDCSVEIATWSDAPKMVDDGDYVQLRLTSSTLLSRTTRATLTNGSSVTVWDVTTQGNSDCGSSPVPGSICADGTIYAGLTPNGNIPMYVTRCDLGMAWDGTNCTGSLSLLPWNNDQMSDNVDTGIYSQVTGEANTASIIAIDSDPVTPGIQPHQAAQACSDLVAHGHSDWYLPASQELRDIIYTNLYDGFPVDGSPDPVVSGFASGFYWTSSDASFSANSANVVDFSTGSANNRNKRDDLYVRCARR